MSTFASIRTEIADLLDGLTGIAYVPSIVPITVPNVKLPACTVFSAGFEQRHTATGGVTDNVWRYRVDFYFAAANQTAAIEAMETALTSLLDSVRDDPSLGGAVDYCDVQDGPDPELVQVDASTPILFKSVSLLCRTEES
jgi:hypothetical protein